LVGSFSEESFAESPLLLADILQFGMSNVLWYSMSHGEKEVQTLPDVDPAFTAENNTGGPVRMRLAEKNQMNNQLVPMPLHLNRMRNTLQRLLSFGRRPIIPTTTPNMIQAGPSRVRNQPHMEPPGDHG
jgi:hypothetical protein